jgi:hypothetical protein
VAELQADLRRCSLVHEVDDAYIPAQPGEMRPSRSTSVISVNSNAAPPWARAP